MRENEIKKLESGKIIFVYRITALPPSPEEKYAKEFFDMVPWGQLHDLGCLQGNGKIISLRYRYFSRGYYIVRFIPTDQVEWPDLFNLRGDYYPDQYEERRKWHSWG